MKLIRAHVIKADTCGGLLDGLELSFRNHGFDNHAFEPFCMVGPNGAGKSQLVQIIAEMLQSAICTVAPDEERADGNSTLQFELEYMLYDEDETHTKHIRIERKQIGSRKPKLSIQLNSEGAWLEQDLESPDVRQLLPRKIVGYTSGGNETLSLPFLLSRSGYAADVAESALNTANDNASIPNTRLMLVDYGTHLEVLVANLLLANKDQKHFILDEANLRRVHSFRCIVQLAHSAVPKAPKNVSAISNRKGVQLTNELENYVDCLKRCCTCYDYLDTTETYTFDFLVNDQTELAFREFWDNALGLYDAFHKLAMLNDLAIPKKTRERFKKEVKSRKFASSLPEPQDEEKVFRFEQVQFIACQDEGIVDYVSLSDGEHQLAQLLGTFCMLSDSNVLFLLDEPESHFNPQWRIKFVSKLLNLPTDNGKRKDRKKASMQECLITTHAPFLPSDMKKENVLIFSKTSDFKEAEEDDSNKTICVTRPSIETYGTTFDEILEECFGVSPPISKVPLNDISELMESSDPEEIREGLERLGNSVDKVFLADRLRQLLKQEGA